jgi:hypothetical protein
MYMGELRLIKHGPPHIVWALTTRSILVMMQERQAGGVIQMVEGSILRPWSLPISILNYGRISKQNFVELAQIGKVTLELMVLTVETLVPLAEVSDLVWALATVTVVALATLVMESKSWEFVWLPTWCKRLAISVSTKAHFSAQEAIQEANFNGFLQGICYHATKFHTVTIQKFTMLRYIFILILSLFFY